jgi:hypothetical protein
MITRLKSAVAESDDLWLRHFPATLFWRLALLEELLRGCRLTQSNISGRGCSDIGFVILTKEDVDEVVFHELISPAPIRKHQFS